MKRQRPKKKTVGPMLDEDTGKFRGQPGLPQSPSSSSVLPVTLHSSLPPGLAEPSYLLLVDGPPQIRSHVPSDSTCLSAPPLPHPRLPEPPSLAALSRGPTSLNVTTGMNTIPRRPWQGYRPPQRGVRDLEGALGGLQLDGLTLSS